MCSPQPFLAGLTIAASGNLYNGKVHGDVRRLTVRYGGVFEDLDIGNCTHLLASQRAVDNDFNKVAEASEVEGLHIVSPDWFFQSVEKELLLDTKKFLLKKPFQRKRQSKRPPAEDSESAKKDSPQTHPNIKEKKQELRAILNEGHRSKDNDMVVWLDDKNTIWDALLINDSSLKESTGQVKTYGHSMEHLQLLYDLETEDFQFWKQQVNQASASALAPARKRVPARKTAPAKETAKAKSPIEEFEQYFQEKTGLSWESRWDDPKENKFVFVPRIFEDVEIEDTIVTGENEDDTVIGSPSLPPAVYEVLGVIFDYRRKSEIEHSIRRVSGDRILAQPYPINMTLRAARSLLERIGEITLDKFQRTDKSRANLLKILGKCYLSLMWNSNLKTAPEWNLPARSADKDWVKREQAALELLHNLSFALDLMENSPKISKNQILNRAYRGLGLAHMTPVGADTEEYKALVKYLSESSVSNYGINIEPVNIFRIEREGEKERFEKYQKAHSSLVGDRRLLFHGSTSACWIGILSQGLRSAAQTRAYPGYAGGLKGIYFADISSKSAAFCRATFTDPKTTSYCMLLCEVEVGKKPQQIAVELTAEQLREKGSISHIAKGQTDYKKWCDAGAIHSDLKGIAMPDTSSGRRQRQTPSLFQNAGTLHNEWVVYDPAQIRQRYFFQLKLTSAALAYR